MFLIIGTNNYGICSIDVNYILIELNFNCRFHWNSLENGHSDKTLLIKRRHRFGKNGGTMAIEVGRGGRKPIASRQHVFH